MLDQGAFCRRSSGWLDKMAQRSSPAQQLQPWRREEANSKKASWKHLDSLSSALLPRCSTRGQLLAMEKVLPSQKLAVLPQEEVVVLRSLPTLVV